MDLDLTLLNLDKLAGRDLKSSEQLRRHSVEASLENKPIERALHLFAVGEEVQRMSIIQSIPELLSVDSSGCMQKVIPKMQQTLPSGSTEYHMLASQTILTVIQKKLLPVDVFAQTFLQTIITSMDNRDPAVANAWLETLIEIIDLLPMNIIYNEICPVALQRSQLVKSVPVRVSSCKLLGAMAKRYDPQILKKDLLTTIISLCQDVNSDVRACMCGQLECIALHLGTDMTKTNLLPCIIELASDEVPKVKEAAFLTVVGILNIFSTELLKSTIVPMIKTLVTYAMKFDDSLLVIISNQYGKMCLGMERALVPADKETYIKWFVVLSELGIPQMRKGDKGRFGEHITAFQNSSVTDKYVLCRQHCAYNYPAMAKFCKDESTTNLETLHIAFCDLTIDPYYMVRRTIACGIHEVAAAYGKNNYMLKNDLVRLLRDDAEEVLEGFLPNLAATLRELVKTGVFTSNFMDTTSIEINRALVKCENVVASTHNWRLHASLLEQLEVLPSLFQSDTIYSGFVTVIFKRIVTCRAVPVRLAAMKTLLILLRHIQKPQHRSEIRNRIINELCLSQNFYDRMLYVRSCTLIFELFSTYYFKEHFFFKTLQLYDDNVPNIRWAMCKILPKLKCMVKLPTDKKLLVQVEAVIAKLAEDKDREVLQQFQSVKPGLDKAEFGKLFPHDQKKYEEEKALGSQVTSNQTERSPAIVSRHPPPVTSTSSGPYIRRADRFTSVQTHSPTFSPLSSSGSLRNYSVNRSTPPSSRSSSASKSISLNDREFLVDAGVRLPSPKPDHNSKVFQASSIPHFTEKVVESNNNCEEHKSEKLVKKPALPRHGIPIRKFPNSQTRTGKVGNVNQAYLKRHSIEVVDLNQNNTETTFDPEKSPQSKPTSKRQSHLPRPLSCVNLPVKIPHEGAKPKLVSRLPVSYNRPSEFRPGPRNS